MTFSGDHLEAHSHWSKTRSNTILALIVFAIIAMLVNPTSRGYGLVGLAILITIMLHEAGHFIAARWAKMKATEFFVGFGPRIWSFKKGETEYGIKAIPLGGYVKIIGMTNMEEVDEEDENRTYRQGHTIKKLIVILAGVTVNIILAYILIFASLTLNGVPKESSESRAIIESVNPNSSAANAGIKKGDQIISVNNVEIKTFEDLVEQISKKNVGDSIEVTYLRDGKTITQTTELEAAINSQGRPTDNAQLGVTRISEYEKLSVIEAVPRSGEAIFNIVKLSGSAMKRLVSPSGISEYSQTVVEGDYERQDRPSSVAGIVNVGGQFVNQDIWFLFYIIALVNVFLALFNLVPLIPLDGGHAAVAIYEGIASKFKKKKVTADFKKLMPLAVIFVGVLIVFSLSALWLDLLQITS